MEGKYGFESIAMGDESEPAGTLDGGMGVESPVRIPLCSRADDGWASRSLGGIGRTILGENISLTTFWFWCPVLRWQGQCDWNYIIQGLGWGLRSAKSSRFHKKGDRLVSTDMHAINLENTHMWTRGDREVGRRCWGGKAEAGESHSGYSSASLHYVKVQPAWYCILIQMRK